MPRIRVPPDFDPEDPCRCKGIGQKATFKQKAIAFSFGACLVLFTIYALTIIFSITTVISFELICKTTNAYKLQQDFYAIHASTSHKALVLANYLLQIPHQYYSARTSRIILYSNWRDSYQPIALQTTQDFMQLNLKSAANHSLSQNNEQYIMVKLLVDLVGLESSLPNIKTLVDVLKSLLTIKATSHLNFLVEELFWTHPFNNVEDLPSLNVVIQPRLQQPISPSTTLAAY